MPVEERILMKQPLHKACVMLLKHGASPEKGPDASRQVALRQERSPISTLKLVKVMCGAVQPLGGNLLSLVCYIAYAKAEHVVRLVV